MKHGVVKLLSAVAALACLVAPFAAQAATYSNAATTLAWVDPSAHTNVTWTGAAGCPAAVDDDITAQLPLGFTFTFGSTDYTTVQIMSNGRLQFNNTYCSYGTATVGPPPTYPDPFPSANVVNTMRVYGADLDPGSGGTVRYASLGTAPNRYFVVTWTNVKEWTQAPSGFNLQVILYENGDFAYQYGSEVNPSGGKAQIGWELTTTDYTDYAFTSILTIANTAIRFYRPGNLAYYAMDEFAWNGTAGEVVDGSGSGNNGVHVGAAQTVVAGHDCRAEDVPTNASTAVISAVNTGLDVDTEIGNAGSISFWYRSNTVWNGGGDRMLLDASSTANSNLFYAMLKNNGTLNFVVEKTGNTIINFSTAAQAFAAGTWVHITVTWSFATPRYQIYINGALSTSSTASGAGNINNVDTLYIGDNRGTYIGTSGNTGTGNSANGRIDEVRIYNYVRTTGQISYDKSLAHSCIDHFTIAHDGYGINCVAENITVNARDSANNAFIGYNQTVTLDTQSGKGTWTLVTGSGVFTDATADDGLATYQWPATESSAVFALSYKSGATPIDIDVYQSSNTLIRDDETEGTMAWSASGFTITSAVLSNPPPGVIPAFTSPQIAGTAFAMYLTAFGTTPTDTQCGVIEAYTGAKNLKFWSTYVNPTTGTRQVTISSPLATTIATVEVSSVAQAVTFTNGQANVTALYRDAGRLTISMKDTNISDPNLPNGIRGTTGNFVSRPSNLVLTNIKRTDNNAPNLGGATPTGLIFLPAGRPFSATVTAYESGGTVTPNFGLETPAESVGLTPALVSPVGGANPATIAAVGFGTFVSGVASGNDFSWPEVGAITLTPHIKDGDYLGAGDFSGTTTGNVGRFIPDHFDMASNVPLFQTACGTGVGAYTYLGQPFRYATQPVVMTTAKAFGVNTTTQNYTSTYFKLSSASVARTYKPVVGLDVGGVPVADVTLSDLGPVTKGVASIRFDLGSTNLQGLAYTRSTAPVAPIASPTAITLEVVVTDTDGVTSTPNPYVVNSAAIAFDVSATQRYGRIAFRNAVGSELLNLPVPMHAEYFQNTATGFAQNSDDSCTAGVTTSLTLGLSGGGTSCLLNASTCTDPSGQQFRLPPIAGDFNAILKAPGAGKAGTVTVTTTVPAWLQFDWNTSAAGLESPTGIATFGIYQGESKRIFQSEK